MKSKNNDIKSEVRKSNSSPVCFLENDEILADYKLPEPPERKKKHPSQKTK